MRPLVFFLWLPIFVGGFFAGFAFSLFAEAFRTGYDNASSCIAWIEKRKP